VAVADQKVTDRYALYMGDCMEVVTKLPPASVHLSLYSPPFAGLYNYSSSERDMSNCDSYDAFMKHYEYLVAELARVTLPGRVTAVHCMDVPSGNTGRDYMTDFPGDIIRLHERHGFHYVARYSVWKDPFAVYLRTMSKNLRHKTCVEDSSSCSAAAADYLIVMRKHGDNPIPIAHPTGLLDYAGSRTPPPEVMRYRGWPGKQTENRYSQWVWRQYASAFWDDVRIDRVLPFRDAKDPEDERHVHPLQLDVIERAVVLWSNPSETVLTPFMGVGSEVYGALINGRRAVGVELKASYYRQAVLNVADAVSAKPAAAAQLSMFGGAISAPQNGMPYRTLGRDVAAVTATPDDKTSRGMDEE
jgi:DNA modification methylase